MEVGPVSGGFAPQDGSRWARLVYLHKVRRTPPFCGLEFPGAPATFVSLPDTIYRCGLEESCIHPRAPRLLTSAPRGPAAGASPPPSPGAALSLSAGCSAHRSDPQGSAGTCWPPERSAEEDRSLRETTKISRTPRKHSVILAPEEEMRFIFETNT